MSTLHSASHSEQINNDTSDHSPIPIQTGPIIERRETLSSLKRALLTPEENRDIPCCVLYGATGSGKSTLARQLCNDAAIKAAFQENIIWFDLGINPTDLLDQINETGVELSPSWFYREDVTSALFHFWELLHNKEVLLILDDVETVEQAILFSPPAPSVYVLFITRSNRLARALHAPEIILDTFTENEASELISRKKLGISPSLLDISHPIIRSPLALDLIFTCLKRNIPIESLHIDNHKPNGFLNSCTYPEFIFHLWKLLLLDTNDVPIEAVKGLGIFPPLTPLSYPVISQFWRSLLDAPDESEIDRLFEALSSFNILKHRAHTNTVSLPYLFSHFLEEHTDFNEQSYHQKLLGLYPIEHILSNAGSIDDYIYRFLTYHLDAANQTDVLFQLLLSAGWITAKIQHTDTVALQEDYHFKRSDRTLRVIEEAIRLSSKVLLQEKSQIVIQLISRLQQIDINAIDQLTESLRTYRATEEIWLDPTYVNLKTPSSSLITAYRGHSASIISLDITGHQILTASEDHTIKLWDFSLNEPKHTFLGLPSPAHIVCFSPDEKKALAASEETLYIWDLETYELAQTLSFHTSRVSTCLFLPDNQSLLSSDESGNVYVTEIYSGQQTVLDSPDIDLIWSMAVTPQQELLFTAGSSSTIQAWDIDTGTLKHSLVAHEDWVWQIKITKDGRHLITASEDKTILIWDLFVGRVIRVLKGHKTGVRHLTLTNDDQFVVSADEEQSIIVWEFNTGKILRSFTGLASWVQDIHAHPEGHGIFLATNEPELKLWSITGTLHREERIAHEKGIRDLVLSPENIHLISASDDATIRKWHVKTGQLVDSFNGHQDWVSDLCISRNGKLIVSSSFDFTLAIWNNELGQLLHYLKGHQDWAWCAAISWDNTFIASGSEDCTVKLWDSSSGNLLHTLEGHKAGVTQVLISPDDKYLISSSLDHTIRVWNVANGTLEHVLEGHTETIRHIKLSLPGQCIVSASDDGSIRIWNYDIGKENQILVNVGGAIQQVHMLYDGYRLLSISDDMALRVWDLVSSTPIYTLAGHTSKISHLAVSEDNRLAATAGSDGKLCLWDLEFGHLTDSYYADYPMTCCTFTTDNQCLISADAGGGLHFFNVCRQEYYTP